MICCRECFADPEIRAAIEMIGRKGECPVCRKRDMFLYDSDKNEDSSNFGELLNDLLEIYVPESELPISYPEEEKMSIEHRMNNDWKIFNGDIYQIRKIIQGYIEESWNLDERLLNERVGIPELYDESFLRDRSIFGVYNWNAFKKCLRNENRFHCQYINLEIMEEVLKDAAEYIPKGSKFFRARVSNEKGTKGYKRKEMGAPPDDVASPGRANSKGQSCLYLSSQKLTTVKEIRAHAFDYVTIATFRTKKDIEVLNLNSMTHVSPFYSKGDKISYIINEKHLRNIAEDMSKPMSRWDSDLDYLPTQYISDFAKACGYDGVKYVSTFDQSAYNIALFNPEVCECIYHKNYLIGNLEYKLQ